MRRGSRDVAATGMAVAGAAAALVLGFLAVEEPATVLPMTLELGLLVGLTWIFLRRERDIELRRWLIRLTFAAVAVRLAALVVVHGVLSPELFAPDVLTYRGQGRVLAEYWRGAGPDPELTLGTQVVYPYLNAVFHYVLGSSTFGVVVLNLFAGVWTMLLAFALGRELLGESAGKVAAVLGAFFPSLVLWSVLNIRDALTAFAVAASVYFGVRVYRSGRPGSLLGVLIAVAVLAGLRDYMAFLVLAGLILGSVALLRPGRVVSSLVVGTALTVTLAFGVERLGFFQEVAVESPLDQLEEIRRGLQQEAGSAYGGEYDTSTVEGALRFLPLGIAFFLFAPFPWAVDSLLQLVALPEVLLWYLLVPFTVVGFASAPDRSRSPAWVVVVSVLLVTVGSYALVEGNFGTAYRHRAQVMPLLFLFTAVGVTRAWEGWRRMRNRRGRRSRGGPLPLRTTASGSAGTDPEGGSS